MKMAKAIKVILMNLFYTMQRSIIELYSPLTVNIFDGYTCAFPTTKESSLVHMIQTLVVRLSGLIQYCVLKIRQMGN